MLFGNPHAVTVSKKILGVSYICPPGEFVEIPDRVAYVIKAEGTMLVPADALTIAQPESPEPEQSASIEQSEPLKSTQPQARTDDRNRNRR